MEMAGAKDNSNSARMRARKQSLLRALDEVRVRACVRARESESARVRAPFVRVFAHEQARLRALLPVSMPV